MKIEEVIKQLESVLDHTRSMAASPDADDIWRKDIDALKFALTALRFMPEAGELLTLEQLREMDGKPVWVVPLKKEDWDSHWDVMKHGCAIAESKTKPGKTYFLYEDSYRIRWCAYPYPPAHIDRSEWTAEWVPMTDDDGCVWLECSTCEYNLDSLEESHPFCPSCGRAMTEEAWAELERRLMK